MIDQGEEHLRRGEMSAALFCFEKAHDAISIRAAAQPLDAALAAEREKLAETIADIRSRILRRLSEERGSRDHDDQDDQDVDHDPLADSAVLEKVTRCVGGEAKMSFEFKFRLT